MRPSFVIVALVVLAFGLGGGYFGFEMYTDRQFRVGLDQALATLPVGTKATYKTAHYSVLTRQANVSGLTVHGLIPGDPHQPFDIVIDSITTTNPNLAFPGSWSRAVADPGSFAPDTGLPVADAVVMKGVTVHSDAINLTESSAQIARLRVYPWALLHDGMPSWREIQASVGQNKQSLELVDPRPILRAEAAVLLGVGYDSYAGADMKFAETLPGIDIEYDIRAMTGDAFDRGVMRGAAGERIALSGNMVGVLSIDRVTMGVIDVRAPMTRLINGDKLSAAMLDGISIGRIEYSGITARPPGQAAIHIGGVSVGPVVFAQGVPVSGETGWTDFRLAKLQIPDPRVWEAFNALGVEVMTVSFSMAYDWDVARQHISVHDTTLKIDELGTLTLAADLSNIAPDTAAMDRGGLAHLRLRFVDASLVDRLLRMGAVASGSDPADYRALIVAMTRQQMLAGATGPMMAAAARAAGDFIASPHSLTIELSPPAPIPFAALQRSAMAPLNLATMPGLSVTANQP